MTLWRQEHPEQYKKQRQKYYEEHKEEILENHKLWMKKNREYYNESQREWRKNNKDKIDLYYQNRRNTQRKLLLDSIGNKCVICGFEESEGKGKLHFHEKYGKEHPYNKGIYILKHKEDFVPLCYRCHNFIHILIRNNGNINKLIELCNWIKKYEKGEVNQHDKK